VLENYRFMASAEDEKFSMNASKFTESQIAIMQKSRNAHPLRRSAHTMLQEVMNRMP